jgi:hypothetical protein
MDGREADAGGDEANHGARISPTARASILVAVDNMTRVHPQVGSAVLAGWGDAASFPKRSIRTPINASRANAIQ